jgi:hypothetical protein
MATGSDKGLAPSAASQLERSEVEKILQSKLGELHWVFSTDAHYRVEILLYYNPEQRSFS